MSKLIKLEFKKYKIKANLIGALIANILMIGILSMIFFIERYEGIITFNNYQIVFYSTRALVNVTFLVFSAVLISKIIIEEYKSKTIYTLFMYPLSRKKIIIAKLIIIAIFTFFCTLISQIVVFTGFYVLQVLTKTTLETLTSAVLLKQLTLATTSSISNAMIGLIPLYFGLKKKSTIATIVSSILIATVLYSNNNEFSLASIAIVPIMFSLIGILAVYLSIKDINRKDVLV